MLKLRGVLGRWDEAKLSQLEAAGLFGGGMSARTFGRWARRFGEEGEVPATGSLPALAAPEAERGNQLPLE